MQKFETFDPEFIEHYRNKTPNFGYNGLGYITYKRTYARRLTDSENENATEEWFQTIQRVIEGAQQIGANYTQQEAERLYEYMFDLKANFAGRLLWQLGTDNINKIGNSGLLNCWFVSMTDLDDFCFLFEQSMLGGGVGYSVQKENIKHLPPVKENVYITHEETKDADFIVPDSREGWVELVRKVLNSFFVTGKSFSYSTILVRKEGEPIHGFGGVSSGPGILIDGINLIQKKLREREGENLTPIDVLDVANILGTIVVSGNVRRSAQIALGDPDDIEYLRAKRWDLGIPNWRSQSNNSVIVSSFDDIDDELWQGYNGNGEPYGIVNMKLSQDYGRLIDGKMKNNSMYPTNHDNGVGTNPCAEITLADGEACNLAELYLNNIESEDELVDAATLLYKTQKAVWNLPSLYEKTRKVVSANRRIGLSVTGVCQSMDKLDWLETAYVKLRAFDKEWSKQQGVPESIKLTTVKPSGTVSLLAGATPGVHPAYSKYYIRRIRIASNDPLVGIAQSAGYKTEPVRNFDGTENKNTMIIEFPCYDNSGTIFAKDMSAIDQLELVKKLQTIWADNAVSVTVYYHKEELPVIKGWLRQNLATSLKSVSFLLHSEHGFDQAPYEEITPEEYDEMVKHIDMSKLHITSSDLLSDISCPSGACPVR